jgi:MFS family permease
MTIQSLLAIGAIIGFLIMPFVSDLKGKKFAMNICLACMLVGNFGIFFGIFKKMSFLIGFSQLITSFGTNSIVAVAYSINSDFFSDDRR